MIGHWPFHGGLVRGLKGLERARLNTPYKGLSKVSLKEYFKKIYLKEHFKRYFKRIYLKEFI